MLIFKAISNLMKNEQKVLIILVFSIDKLDHVISKLPEKNFIIHTSDAANEKEASEWISGNSDKKFFIADVETAAGHEFTQ